MQVLSKETNIDFMGKRYLLVAISVVLTAACFYIWEAAGDAKFGVDFRGGFEYVVRFNEDVQLEELRNHLHEAGFGDVLVQNFEGGKREFSVRLKAEDDSDVEATAKKIKTEFAKIRGASFEILKEDYVGPVIGEQIKKDGLKAFIVSLVVILIYLTFQFNFSWAVAAILALFHDAVIATGATILCKIELSGATLAAVLTIVGYSVNDTIIIFDRVRENLKEQERGGTAGRKGISEKLKSMSLSDVMNFSINQTLGRTIITSVTVMIVCLSLWLLGNSSVSELAFTLLIGTIVGTYSTMFIACPIILDLQKLGWKKKAK